MPCTQYCADQPGYGIAQTTEGLLPFTWAEARLTAARAYWVATVTPGGAPHLTPVWGVWVDTKLWFSSGASSRKATNLRRQSTVAIATDDAAAAVVLEGTAALVDLVPDDVVRAYETKYATDLRALAEPVYRVTPAKLIGLRESDFTTSATRWRLLPESPGRG